MKTVCQRHQMISMSEDGGKNFKVIVPYSGVHPPPRFLDSPERPIVYHNGNGRNRYRVTGKWQFAEFILPSTCHIDVDNDVLVGARWLTMVPWKVCLYLMTGGI
jgi:hypothetical protein